MTSFQTHWHKGLSPAKIFKAFKWPVHCSGVHKALKNLWEIGSCISKIRSAPEKFVRTKKQIMAKISEKLRRNPGRRARKLAAEEHIAVGPFKGCWTMTSRLWLTKSQNDNSFLRPQRRRYSKDQSFFWISSVMTRIYKISGLIKTYVDSIQVIHNSQNDLDLD